MRFAAFAIRGMTVRASLLRNLGERIDEQEVGVYLSFERREDVLGVEALGLELAHARADEAGNPVRDKNFRLATCLLRCPKHDVRAAVVPADIRLNFCKSCAFQVADTA